MKKAWVAMVVVGAVAGMLLVYNLLGASYRTRPVSTRTT
jgi:hypothetical protein